MELIVRKIIWKRWTLCWVIVRFTFMQGKNVAPDFSTTTVTIWVLWSAGHVPHIPPFNTRFSLNTRVHSTCFSVRLYVHISNTSNDIIV